MLINQFLISDLEPEVEMLRFFITFKIQIFHTLKKNQNGHPNNKKYIQSK